MALEVINAQTPLTVGGSADLTGSNNTLTKGMEAVAPGAYDARYVYFGVREHGMAAALNGLALHGGFVPYGGTFLVFTDYARAAMRLSALMGLRVIYVMTHDSIGLGEDGPTHQPVEHVASLRAMPNMRVFRPCDAVETAECWQVALASASMPSTLALSRQNLPTLRGVDSGVNMSAKGAYILREADGERDVTFLATGSEVHLAVEAAERLSGEGVRAAVVSMPSWDVFDAQNAAYRAEVLGTAPRIAIEAGVEMGWSRYTGDADAFIGMNSFGASAPAGDLFTHFGITSDALVAKARATIGNA
jgi:transketolase